LALIDSATGDDCPFIPAQAAAQQQRWQRPIASLHRPPLSPCERDGACERRSVRFMLARVTFPLAQRFDDFPFSGVWSPLLCDFFFFFLFFYF